MGKNYFNPDVRDLKFVLFEYLKVADLLKYEAFRDFSEDDFQMIIQEAMKVGKEVLGPANQDGDREGCTYENGVVKVPGSFHQCWKVMAENSWICPGGQAGFWRAGSTGCLERIDRRAFPGGQYGLHDLSRFVHVQCTGYRTLWNRPG